MYQGDLNQLVCRLKENDQMAFKRLFLLLFPPLVQFAYALIGDRFVAEEVVNDVFMKIWLRRHDAQPIQNIKVYLYTSVKHAALNQIRSEKNSQKYQAGIEHFFVDFEFNPNPEQIYLGKETKVFIEKAVNKLPAKCKLIFQMVKEEGLSMQEVSEILNLSYKTVHAQMKIALSKLELALAARTKERI